MKKKQKRYVYVYVSEEDGYIQTSGISHQEFCRGIQERPLNHLILGSHPGVGRLNHKLGLEYVLPEDFEDFATEDIYYLGDFCWVDFDDIKELDAMPEEQLAELLYFAHRWKPLKSLYFSNLNNKYAYCAHDDGWLVCLYAKNLKAYQSVLEYMILKELKGKKRSIEPLPADLLAQIFDLAKSGALIDFEESYTTGVQIYNIGRQNNMDGIHQQLDEYRKKPSAIWLDYNPSTRKWKNKR